MKVTKNLLIVFFFFNRYQSIINNLSGSKFCHFFLSFLSIDVNLDVPVVLVEEPLEPVVGPHPVEGVGEHAVPPAEVETYEL